jgi:hypothetical protein
MAFNCKLERVDDADILDGLDLRAVHGFLYGTKASGFMSPSFPLQPLFQTEARVGRPPVSAPNSGLGTS